MKFLLIAVTIAWVITILGWLNEDRYRKKLLEIIRKDVKSEIGWIKLHGEQQVRRDEIKAYKTVLEILSKYDGKESE